MKEIKKLRVNIISLVDKPANRKSVIYKSDSEGSASFEIELRHLRKDEAKGIIYGIVYEPNTVDTQGDWAKADVIEEAAHDFLQKGNVQMVDMQHNCITGSGTIVESYIKNGPNSNYPDAKDGAWAVAIKLSDDAKPLIGQIGGLSLYGIGSYQAEPNDTSMDASAAGTKGAATKSAIEFRKKACAISFKNRAATNAVKGAAANTATSLNNTRKSQIKVVR